MLSTVEVVKVTSWVEITVVVIGELAKALPVLVIVVVSTGRTKVEACSVDVSTCAVV